MTSPWLLHQLLLYAAYLRILRFVKCKLFAQFNGYRFVLLVSPPDAPEDMENYGKMKLHES